MNEYVKNVDRIEFVITYACTGKCKHCSEGDHIGFTESIDGDIAANAVRRIAESCNIKSLMTFGGEPLLHIDTVCKIHKAARKANIPVRQLITNGFFSKDTHKILETAEKLAEAGVNDLLLSVDAFHQESIPIEPVKAFALAIKESGVKLRVHPAWLVSAEAENPYNAATKELIHEFEELGIPCNDGNVIFPQGNALKYLAEYFDLSKPESNPYDESPYDVRSICFNPNGDVLDGNVYKSDIIDIMNAYNP